MFQKDSKGSGSSLVSKFASQAHPVPTWPTAKCNRRRRSLVQIRLWFHNSFIWHLNLLHFLWSSETLLPVLKCTISNALTCSLFHVLSARYILLSFIQNMSFSNHVDSSNSSNSNHQHINKYKD